MNRLTELDLNQLSDFLFLFFNRKEAKFDGPKAKRTKNDLERGILIRQCVTVNQSKCCCFLSETEDKKILLCNQSIMALLPFVFSSPFAGKCLFRVRILP